jgi:Tfp pilus assembly protein PilZ
MGKLSALFLDYARLDRKRTDEGLTVEELEHWSYLKRSLTLHFSPGLNLREVDRRRSIRVPTCLHVTYDTEGGFEGGSLTKLSRNGAFVPTTAPLPPGSEVLLRIHVEEDGTELEIPGEVITSQSHPSFGEDQVGMGIKFSKMPPETAKRLGDLYESMIHRMVANDGS